MLPPLKQTLDGALNFCLLPNEVQVGRSVEQVVADEFRAVYGEELGHVS